MNISSIIRRQRKKLGMSQADLSRASTLLPSGISQYETGVRKPGSAAIVNLSNALQVSTDYLVGHNVPDHSDLLRDPTVGIMLEGVATMSNEDFQAFYKFYEFLRYRDSNGVA